MSNWEAITPSANSQRTANPIRGIVDRIQPDPNHPKSFLKLSIGDPTLDGNLLPPQCAIDAIKAAVDSHKFDGYAPSFGYPDARKAVADYWNDNFSAADRPKKFEGDDVIVASGASHALEMAFSVFCDAGDTLLMPAPGFSLYGVICSNKSINKVTYKCAAEKNWEVDVPALEKQIVELNENNKKLKAIVFNNPSNPAGSNFSKEHVAALCALCAKYKLPIISDEIYAGMVFGGASFTSVASFPQCPAIIVGGLAKSYVAPGWRMGWMMKHDLVGAFDNIWKGCISLSQLLIGPNTIVQAALPKILSGETKQYREELTKTLESQAMLCYDLLSKSSNPGLKPVKPGGAMYLLIGIDCEHFDPKHGISDDVTFSQKLMQEMNVQVLPGTIFDIPGFVRIVFSKPPEQLKEAVARIVDFADNMRKV